MMNNRELAAAGRIMADEPKPRRPFFRYSLRTLMLVVTVFCIWMGMTTKRARDQRHAVEMIQELGGQVQYEHERDRSNPPGPEWLRQLIGGEYFFRATGVELDGPKFNGESLAAISRFTDLTLLTLVDANITDDDLINLKGLTKLRRLDLASTHVTDAGLMHLEGLTNLRDLWLASTQVTDAGLVYVKGLTNLDLLDLSYTQVTDEGVNNLQQALPNCKILR